MDLSHVPKPTGELPVQLGRVSLEVLLAKLLEWHGGSISVTDAELGVWSEDKSPLRVTIYHSPSDGEITYMLEVDKHDKD